MSLAASAVASEICIEKFKIEIAGLPPGIIFQKKIKEQGTKAGVNLPKEVEADLHAHWTVVDGQKSMGIPWVSLYQCICKAGGDFKWRKKALTWLLAPTISCDLDIIPLNTDQFEVFVSDVRIPPRTGPMVEIGRPRLREWKASFILNVDPEMYASGYEKTLLEVVKHAGKMVGLGAWRPQLKGPYGKFSVTKFEKQ